MTTLNNCDSTGTNTALCENSNTGGIINDITGIEQDNTATLTGESSRAFQQNNARVDQQANLANTCSETGTGTSDVECINDASNFVDQITQNNDATGQDGDDIGQQNQVVIDQNLNAVNDCDEQDSGNNFADCSNVALNEIGTITQTNTGTGDGN